MTFSTVLYVIYQVLMCLGLYVMCFGIPPLNVGVFSFSTYKRLLQTALTNKTKLELNLRKQCNKADLRARFQEYNVRCRVCLSREYCFWMGACVCMCVYACVCVCVCLCVCICVNFCHFNCVVAFE